MLSPIAAAFHLPCSNNGVSLDSGRKQPYCFGEAESASTDNHHYPSPCRSSWAGGAPCSQYCQEELPQDCSVRHLNFPRLQSSN